MRKKALRGNKALASHFLRARGQAVLPWHPTKESSSTQGPEGNPFLGSSRHVPAHGERDPQELPGP
eukprot:2654705-Lingulodinium_polyedra.AAC.1